MNMAIKLHPIMADGGCASCVAKGNISEALRNLSVSFCSTGILLLWLKFNGLDLQNAILEFVDSFFRPDETNSLNIWSVLRE